MISILQILQNEYHCLEGNEDNKKLYYYQKRELYNIRKEEQSGQAALFIFLNRTCFNGLYRVNSKNLYNVPMGGYKKPTICDKENILAVSEALQKEFNDSEQIRLKDFCSKLDALNHNWILSNSDVKGKDENDNFFDDLYSDFSIQRVEAKRSINANPEKRGKLTELLITNQVNNKEYVRAI